MAEEEKDAAQKAAASAPAAAGVVTSTQSLAWVEKNQGIAIAIAFVLTALYVAPVMLVGIAAAATDGFQQPSFAFTWFSAFMKNSDATLNEFHKILLPVIAALSVIVFRGGPDWRLVSLGVFILVAFVGTTFIGVMFDIPTIQDAAAGLPNPPQLTLVKAFFTRIEETLLMYLMMLLGIGVSNAARK